MQLSLFVKTDDAPIFNLLVRILTPSVFVILVATVLYQFNLDAYTTNIYLIVVYYFAFRLIFNIAAGRSRLLNWPMQFIHFSITFAITYYIYDKILRVKANILPDFSTISNELWIIIVIFLYELFNKISFSDERSRKRKRNYLDNRYHLYRNKFQTTISPITNNDQIESLIYSIMLYEAFNRPKAYRIVEAICFWFGISKTLGIMQVKTDKYISDKESVRLGAQKVVADLLTILSEKGDKYLTEWDVQRSIINKYNGGRRYLSEIEDLNGLVLRFFYTKTTDKLFDGVFINKDQKVTAAQNGGS
jgi:hypothetical protein